MNTLWQAIRCRLNAKLTFILLCLTPASLCADPEVGAAFLDESSVPWKSNEFDIARWKTLVGGLEGGQIPQSDVQFGLWNLAPHGIYHRHSHEAPEIYYILSGKALWTVGDEEREVGPGTIIYTRPNTEHAMVNRSSDPVQAIWVWWAPGGDAGVFAADYNFTENAPAQPANAGFHEGAAKKLYTE